MHLKHINFTLTNNNNFNIYNRIIFKIKSFGIIIKVVLNVIMLVLKMMQLLVYVLLVILIIISL